MADISHAFGSDLQVDATGDLLVSSGSQLGQERVLRRLMSNPQSYIWSPDYGAGLARFLGEPAAEDRIAAIIRSQMRLEAAVARIPPPAVTVSVDPAGVVTATIRYVDAETGDPVSLALPPAG